MRSIWTHFSLVYGVKWSYSNDSTPFYGTTVVYYMIYTYIHTYTYTLIDSFFAIAQCNAGKTCFSSLFLRVVKSTKSDNCTKRRKTETGKGTKKKKLCWLSKYQERENSKRGIYAARPEVVIDEYRERIALFYCSDRLKRDTCTYREWFPRLLKRERHRLQPN